MGMGGQHHAPAALSPGKRPRTHFIGGWVGPRAGLDGCRKSRSRRNSIPGPSSPQPVAIPIELSRHTLTKRTWNKQKWTEQIAHYIHETAKFFAWHYSIFDFRLTKSWMWYFLVFDDTKHLLSATHCTETLNHIKRLSSHVLTKSRLQL
jgi:hypothetical protein